MSPPPDSGGANGSIWRKLLFVAIAGFYWITLTPFVDLSRDPALAKPASWSFALTIAVFAALLTFAMRREFRAVVTQPRLLLGLVYGWLLVTAVLAHDPVDAVRRVVIAMTVCLSASAFLLLPANERQFSRLLGTVAMLVVGLCYFGVLFLPHLAIHQASDFLEPGFAGLWRGIYVQKNAAGGVMVMSCFVGLYLMSSWSRAVGLLLVVASCIFLVKTGSKTSTIMLPGILVLGYLVERWRGLRAPLVLGGVAALNLATVGVVAVPGVRETIAGFGIDPTYTARSDIWKLALDAIRQSPIVGHGFESFWQTDALVHSDRGAFTWAVTAVDAHNAYLDAAVTAGIPGLILIVAWVLVSPLRSLGRIDADGAYTPLTRLFLRIWLFGIFLACLESVFLANSGPGWFMPLVGIFGLRYQARFPLSSASAARVAAGKPDGVPA